MPNPKLRVSARWSIKREAPEISYFYGEASNGGIGSARNYDIQKVGVAISGLIKKGYSLEIDEKSFETDLRLKQARIELSQAIEFQE